jgi:peptidyl-prolyl cis-trans isomerase A (cyclophilin A)
MTIRDARDVIIVFAICLLPFAIRAADKPANPKAVIQTTAGDLTCELYQEKAPRAVSNFINLAEGRQKWFDQKSKKIKEGVPLYDGTIFHRVIPGFMIQGGDPTGTGVGEIGYTLKDEFAPDLKFDRPGRLAYANSGPNTSASQFFIAEEAYPAGDPCLNDKGCDRGGHHVAKGVGYMIFGQCDMSSVELVKWIAKAGRDLDSNRPIRPVVIRHIQIVRPQPPAH